MSLKRLFNDEWQFAVLPVDAAEGDEKKNTVEWEKIDLPHDWQIYNVEDLYAEGQAWYKKSFDLNKENNRIYSLRFEGVYMNSTVYVNGHIAGEWKYGYSTFEFDITDYIIDGKNEVEVRAEYRFPNSRWYSGAGINRNVWFIERDSIHIVPDGIYFASRLNGNLWTAEIETELCNSNADNVTVEYIINDINGNVIASDKCSTTGDKAQCTIDNIKADCWDIESPVLYSLSVHVIYNNNIVDEDNINIGFRTIELKANEGFFLNGRHIKINGACEHNDLGCLGAAINKAAIRRKLTILKEMGVNSIRTTHNMPPVELMELADEMGILINSEAFDMWENSKNPYDYARFFNEWYEKDVSSWVRRDRNHPSIIMWSIGNEIYDTHADAVRGLEETEMLKACVEKYDPKKNGYVTFGSNFLAWENTQISADKLKIVGYNYTERLYADHHEKHPDWIIYGSETASTVQSRGVYHFPKSEAILTDDDEQCSSLGNSTTSWGAKNSEACIIADRDAKFSLGQYIWTGFDYIGEPTPYKTKNSYYGQVDTAGFKKDSYYIYQAEWTDYKKAPMVHVLPYWDFNEGQMIDVRVCSNAPKVELFYNGVSQGTFDIDHVNGKQLVGEWQLPYHKGCIEAIAYDENNNIIARDIQRSFADPVQILMTPDKTQIKADGDDLVFIEINTCDADGTFVANANNIMNVSVEGCGRLIGLDNGDSTDYEQYKGTCRKLFAGRLLAVVAATKESGPITVTVTSPGLPDAHLTIEAAKTEARAGISCTMTNKISDTKDEIPIRKIELVCGENRTFTPDIKTIEVEAQLYPANATASELEWQIITDAGIESNVATIDVEGTKVLITARGDGKFRLRCRTRNGNKAINVASVLEFAAEGLGAACLNPYDFITAGLYDYHKGTVSSASEFGIATARDKETCVGFKNVDFGSFGSDEISIPIFAFTDDEFAIQIWDGCPGEADSEMLADVIYQKPVIWDVYQPETYKLSRKIKGVRTVCIVTQDFVNIKGFSFTKIDKAWAEINATEYDSIYGDMYNVEKDAVCNIGNNVSFEFKDMDFGEKGADKIIICGNSPIDLNSIHITAKGDNGEIKQMVEFEHSNGFMEREFNIEKLTGINSISFVFLPGSNFDFKYFRFVTC